jgi:pimeloyl-ACP methyl ester carboxylesterase
MASDACCRAGPGRHTLAAIACRPLLDALPDPSSALPIEPAACDADTPPTYGTDVESGKVRWHADEAGFDTFNFVSYSLGGVVALGLAATRSQRVQSLALSAAGGQPLAAPARGGA